MAATATTSNGNELDKALERERESETNLKLNESDGSIPLKEISVSHNSSENLSSEGKSDSISKTPDTDSKTAAQDGPKKLPEDERSKAKTIVLMLALCMAVFLAALDTSIITTALPTITHEFNASEADYTWIGSSFLLAAAAATPLWGKVSDIFGRKPVLLAANVVFFVGSLICALAVNVNMLIAGRVVQGVGGGGLLSLVNICISDLFSMRTRGFYFGMVGMTWAIASALGPLLGGVFTELVTWRWCFWINLPCDGAAFVALILFLDVETPRTPFVKGFKSIDWLGCLTVVGGTVMLLLGLEFGGVTFPWNSATVICLIVFGIVTLGLFFVVQAKIAKYPIIPLRIFSNRTTVCSLLTAYCHGTVFISGSYFLPLYFQAVLGASPLLSGVYLLPYVLSLSFASVATGFFIRKTGKYLPPIWAGMFFLTVGFGLMIDLQPYASWSRIIIFQLIAGIGAGPNFQAPLIALQSAIKPQDVGTATATFAFTRNLGTSISVVIGGAIFQNEMTKMIANANLPASVIAELSGGSAGANTGIVAALPASERSVAVDSYTDSLQVMWIFYTVVGFVGLCISLLIRKNVLNKDHTVTKTGLEAQEQHRLQMKEEARQRKAMALAGRGKTGRKGGLDGVGGATMEEARRDNEDVDVEKGLEKEEKEVEDRLESGKQIPPVEEAA